MVDLSPNSFQHLASRIEKDGELATSFANFRSNGGTEDRIDICDSECRQRLSCFLQHSVFIDNKLCLNQKPIEIGEKMGWRSQFGIHWLFEMMTDPWYEYKE